MAVEYLSVMPGLIIYGRNNHLNAFLSPELLFYGGLAVCGFAALGMIVAMIILRLSKTRLNKRLDDEFGKARI